MYQQIALQLLRQRRELAHELKLNRMMLWTARKLAEQLKAGHEDWKLSLAKTKPGEDPQLIAGEALELAIDDLQRELDSTQPDDSEPLSLDGAMAFVRRHTPPA